MNTLTVYGASDDLIEFGGIDSADEFYPNVRKGPYRGTFIVESQSEAMGLQIHVLYDGCWSFAISADDSETLPNWPIRRGWGVRADNLEGSPYSEYLEIDVPDDALLKQVD